MQPAAERPAQGLSESGRACLAWVDSVDQAVDASGVRDASAYRVPGFPYLRVDRFSASFRRQAAANAPAFDAWVERLRGLDASARSYEIGNLSLAVVRSVGASDARSMRERTAQCTAQLAREDLAAPARRASLLEQAVVPDDYADWARKSGLYAIARGPFFVGVERWYREAEEMFRKAASGEAYATNLRRYRPEGAPVSEAQVKAIVSRAASDALGVPQIGARDAVVLFRAYAPQYEIEATGTHDHFGLMKWSSEEMPTVDVSHPTVYRRLAYTRYGGRTLLQLVYTAWFPERPASGSMDLLAGKLDGLVLRVTLDPDGRPLVYDTIHPCGCYHMFFPTASMKLLPAPDPNEEWAFVPATLPAMQAAQGVTVRLASGSHYVVGVQPQVAQAGASSSEIYGFANDDDLRALPAADGRTRSAFGPDGLVSGTERAERLLFWPMGIASPGAMRQWGRQPTAFVGRSHFDDPDLIEKRFRAVHGN